MTDKLKLPVVHVCLGARMTDDGGYGVRKASVWIGYAEQAREHDDDLVVEYSHIPTCSTCANCKHGIDCVLTGFRVGPDDFCSSHEVIF